MVTGMQNSGLSHMPICQLLVRALHCSGCSRVQSYPYACTSPQNSLGHQVGTRYNFHACMLHSESPTVFWMLQLREDVQLRQQVSELGLKIAAHYSNAGIMPTYVKAITEVITRHAAKQQRRH
jgi:hypothetical protein